MSDQTFELSKVKLAMLSLLAVVKNTLLTLWWVIGIAGTAALFWYPMQQIRLQAIVFAAVSVVYALVSRGLYKVKEVEEKYA